MNLIDKFMKLFISEYKWVYSMHAFIIGPYFALLGYLLHKYSKGYTMYEEFLNSSAIALIIIGLVMSSYHGYKWLIRNKFI
tara:strand:+ start:566 stop:808 length:243 start_codon:yes stop_codon:yes gene_type:complete